METTGLGSSPGRLLGQHVGSQRLEDMIQSHGEGNGGGRSGSLQTRSGFILMPTLGLVLFSCQPGTVGLIICGLQMWFKEEVNYPSR